jgi:hypothetical protein
MAKAMPIAISSIEKRNELAYRTALSVCNWRREAKVQRASCVALESLGRAAHAWLPCRHVTSSKQQMIEQAALEFGGTA